MTVSAETAPVPGPLEAQTRELLDTGWRTASIEQRGPDGSEVLMVLAFFVCPVCFAVVAPTDGEDEYVWRRKHAKRHLDDAISLDEVTSILLGATGATQTCGASDCTVYSPLVMTEAGVRCSAHREA